MRGRGCLSAPLSCGLLWVRVCAQMDKRFNERISALAGATSRDLAGATRPGRVSSLVMLVALGVVPLLAPAPVFSAVL